MKYFFFINNESKAGHLATTKSKSFVRTFQTKFSHLFIQTLLSYRWSLFRKAKICHLDQVSDPSIFIWKAFQRKVNLTSILTAITFLDNKHRY